MSTPSPGPFLPPAAEDLRARPQASPITSYIENARSPRNLLFLTLVIASFFLFHSPLRVLLHSPADGHYSNYSYTLAIPLVSVALVFFERRKIFIGVGHCIGTGVVLLLTGVILNWIAERGLSPLGAGNSLSIKILALVVFWIGGFVLCYGTQAFRARAFSLLFLLLTVPIPDSLLDRPITAVQYGSTEVYSLVLNIAGVPALRNGLEISLPNTTIKVAKQCAGIHSTIAIFLISLIAGHLYLPSRWMKVVLVFVALPVVCVSNGLRIAGLALLAEYVDPSYLYGNLHHHGGIGFFLLGLLLLLSILQLLRRSQNFQPHLVKSCESD
jgi:exosortase